MSKWLHKRGFQGVVLIAFDGTRLPQFARFNSQLLSFGIMMPQIHEKVYLRSNRKCCVVDFRVDRDHLNQYCNFGKIRTGAAKSNSTVLREKFDVMEILKG